MPDLRALIDSLPNPVILVGQDQRIRAINSPARDLIGQDCDGWHYITALRQPAILDAVEAGLAQSEVRFAQYTGHDGARDTTWDVTVRGADMHDGPVVVVSFQDVTAVEDASVMRRGFVANVSHELRTPLTSLLGFIETLQGPARDDTAAQQRFLDIMKTEADRMHHLVEGLLSLSRVEDLERIRPTDNVTLQPLIHSTLNALIPVAKAGGITFDLSLPDDPVTVLGDEGQLGQVIRNLVENAIKYGPAQGTITLTLTAPQSQAALMQTGVQLSVRDRGAGIASHHIARLTERFFRVDTHRSREIGGSGLGLAIVKHIINRHRGRLRIESNLGQGTVFKVILPTG